MMNNLRQKFRSHFSDNEDFRQIIHSSQEKLIHENKLVLLRKFIYFMLFSNFYYQCLQFHLIINPEKMEDWVIQVTYWGLWVTMFIMVVLSKVKKKLGMIKPSLVLLLVRNIIPMLDFDRKRDKLEANKLNTFVIFQVNSVTMILVCINFVSGRRVSIPLTTIGAFVTILGMFKMQNKGEDSIIFILSKDDNLGGFVQMLLNSLLGLYIIQYLLNFGQNEILKAWNMRDTTQKELITILESLEESIITRKKNGLGYCNQHGKHIIELIKDSL